MSETIVVDKQVLLTFVHSLHEIIGEMIALLPPGTNVSTGAWLLADDSMSAMEQNILELNPEG